MRLLAASVLFFEAVVVALAVPAAIALTDTSPGLLVAGGLGLALSCLLCAGLLRWRAGYVLGSALQVAVIASGLVVPAMYVLGLVFAGLWVLALVLPGRAERVRAQRLAEGPPAAAR